MNAGIGRGEIPACDIAIGCHRQRSTDRRLGLLQRQPGAFGIRSKASQERALFWTTFVDMERYVERMEWQMKELGVRLVAPSHGVPVTDLERTWPEIRKGLPRRRGQVRRHGRPSPRWRPAQADRVHTCCSERRGDWISAVLKCAMLGIISRNCSRKGSPSTACATAL
jgi:hypothetical protein